MRIVTINHKQDEFRFSVPTEADWKDVADYLFDRLVPGDVVALSGPLGAGKTTCVQALAKKMGTKKTPQSPTFSLMRSYPLSAKGNIKRLVHVDAYRIEHERELLALDLDEELADGKSMLVIEWPEKIPNWFINRPEVWNVDIRSK